MRMERKYLHEPDSLLRQLHFSRKTEICFLNKVNTWGEGCTVDKIVNTGCRMHRVENRILFSITGYENINMFPLNPEIAQELVPTQAKKKIHAENQKWLLQRCWIAGGCPTPAPLWTPLDLKHTFFQNWGMRTESKQDNKQTGHGVGSLPIIDMGCNCGGRAWSGRISNWPGRISNGAGLARNNI